MPNPAADLIDRSDAEREMDERVLALKRRAGVPDRPVTSRTDRSIVNGNGRKRKPARKPAQPWPRACVGCGETFRPSHKAHRYCPPCREERSGDRRPEPPAAPPEPVAAPEPATLAVVASEPRTVAATDPDSPLRDRLLARMRKVGARLHTSELAKGVHVHEPHQEVEAELWRLAADGLVEPVVSWRIAR